MSNQPYFVDSLAPLTEEALTFLLAKTGGRKPLAWGRYLDADLSRDLDVAAAHDIPLLLIARRSSRVCLGITAGVVDGAADRARVEAILALAKTKGARVLSRVFLDVEMRPDLTAGYWSAWSKAFDGAAFVPCAYMPNRNFWPASWVAIEAAIATGARCGGTWVALYHQPTDGSAVLRDEDWSTRPHASDVVQTLAWQHTGNAYGGRYDGSMPNPDVVDWLADTLGAAPIEQAPSGTDAALEAAAALEPATCPGVGERPVPTGAPPTTVPSTPPAIRRASSGSLKAVRPEENT